MISRQAQKNVALAFPAAVPYLALFMRGIINYAKQHGPWIFTMSPVVDVPFPETLSMPLGTLRDWPGDGIIAAVSTQEEAEQARQLKVPVINLAGALRDSGLPRVMVDHHAIGRLAAEHLLECGLRRFLYVGIEGLWYSEQRRDGFAERIAEAGEQIQICETPRRIHPAASWQARLDEIDVCLEGISPPVGILAVHDYRARLLIDECLRLGLHVPDDVAILGVDNDDVICEFCQPTLSSVSRSAQWVGYQSAALLDRLMSGETPPKHDVLIPPDGVVKRQSTDVIAVHDAHVLKVVRFIHDHVDEPFGVEKLLQLVSISRRQLETLFKKHLGRTPYEYLCQMRVRRAKDLLWDPEGFSIAEVAQLCGFPDSYRFRLVFTRLTGETPTAYRRRIPRQS
ncbi:MAG: substrate-binding domain-containing protein [Pirellulales bacterium]|nr:substrate-binding domain-containing protein [Pirellulales bacterium]